MLEVRLLRRYGVSRKFRAAVHVIFFLAGILTFATIETFYGLDFYDVLVKLFIEPVTTSGNVQVTLRYAVPIGLCALGLITTYRAGIYSIGAEGQMALGAILATWSAFTFASNLPAPLSTTSVILVGALGGALWSLAPGLLKGLLNVNEVLTTLMLNFVAYTLTDYLIYGPWRSPKAYNFPLTEPIPQSVAIPSYKGFSPTSIAVFIVSVAVVYVILKYSKLGYEIRAYGSNPSAAYASGISFLKVSVISFLISGFFAGLAGALQLASVHYRLGPKPWSVTEGLGYTAIISAWIARLEPIAVLPSAILMGVLINGGLTLKASLGQPEGIVNIMNGLILLAIIASEFLINYRVRVKFMR